MPSGLHPDYLVSSIAIIQTIIQSRLINGLMTGVMRWSVQQGGPASIPSSIIFDHHAVCFVRDASDLSIGGVVRRKERCGHRAFPHHDTAQRSLGVLVVASTTLTKIQDPEWQWGIVWGIVPHREQVTMAVGGYLASRKSIHNADATSVQRFYDSTILPFERPR